MNHQYRYKKPQSFLEGRLTVYILAAMEGRKVAGKYRIRPVDVELSKEKDRKLLLEYDLARMAVIGAAAAKGDIYGNVS